MNSPQIELVNKSTLITDAEIAVIMKALEIQVTRDFEPVWGIGVALSQRQADSPLAGAWQLIFLDDADQADALGYHDVTAEGMPLGKVFVAADKRAGEKVSVTASHELLELLADPQIDTCVSVSDDSGDRFFALEVADACESDMFGYSIDGVIVSDFVYPEWFTPLVKTPGTRYDFQGKITYPLQLLSGGYIDVYRPGSGWTQVTAGDMLASARSRGHVGSRRERRRIPKARWLLSTGL